MKRRRPPQLRAKGIMEPIKWQPGYTLDFEHPGGAIRDAQGNLVAEEIWISKEDADYIREKARAFFKKNPPQ